MLYGLFKDSQLILGPMPLPAQWKNISRLDLAPADMLAELGWYPVNEGTQPAVDPATQQLQISYELDGTTLNQKFTVVDYSSEELEEMDQFTWNQIRYDRDLMLANTDWVELPSVRALHDAQWAQNWDTYRQALRDITKATAPKDVVWPEKPA
jgi:Phage tail assembly chaperone protein